MFLFREAFGTTTRVWRHGAIAAASNLHGIVREGDGDPILPLQFFTSSPPSPIRVPFPLAHLSALGLEYVRNLANAPPTPTSAISPLAWETRRLQATVASLQRFAAQHQGDQSIANALAARQAELAARLAEATAQAPPPSAPPIRWSGSSCARSRVRQPAMGYVCRNLDSSHDAFLRLNPYFHRSAHF